MDMEICCLLKQAGTSVHVGLGIIVQENFIVGYTKRDTIPNQERKQYPNQVSQNVLLG